MSQLATAKYDLVRINVEIRDLVITVDVPNGYEDVKNLPDAIEFNNMLYGMTGWNSDRNVAYFRSDSALGKWVKI